MSEDRGRRNPDHFAGSRPRFRPYCPPGTPFHDETGWPSDSEPTPAPYAPVWPSLTSRSQREIESGSEVTACEAAKPVGAGTAGQVEAINRACATNRNQLPPVQEEPQDDSTAQFGGQPDLEKCQNLVKEAVDMEKRFENLSKEEKSSREGSKIVHELVSICLDLRHEAVSK